MNDEMIRFSTARCVVRSLPVAFSPSSAGVLPTGGRRIHPRPTPAVAGSGPAESGRALRLLIVDDSPLLRGYLMDLVAEVEGVELVGQVADVPAALAAVHRLQPDVVVLDIFMPGGSGIEVLKTIKREQPATVVMMFTNYPFPQYRQECLGAGADFFFDKSLEFEALGAALKKLVLYTRLHQG